MALAEQRIRNLDETYARLRTGPFEIADGVRLVSSSGKVHIDFLSGDGSFNYGYREPTLRRALVDHVRADAGSRGKDLGRDVRRRFVERFDQYILRRRGLDYRLRFTGSRATEALAEAVKIARETTRRETIVKFSDAIGGEPSGGHENPRFDIGGCRVVAIPFSDAEGAVIERIERACGTHVGDTRSPAAIVIECARCDGDLGCVSSAWMRTVAAFARRRGALLVVDETRTGCGRCGDFFAFERSGIEPDVVMLSAAVSGYGLPLSIVLVRSALGRTVVDHADVFVRGTQRAFVTASAALERFWSDGALMSEVALKAALTHHALRATAAAVDLPTTGSGLAQGLEFEDARTCARVVAQCRRDGLLVASNGPRSTVLKVMPALIVPGADLAAGLELLRAAVMKVLSVESRVRDCKVSIGG